LKQRLNENDNDLLFIREMIWNVWKCSAVVWLFDGWELV
jgi:hypothetical protein